MFQNKKKGLGPIEGRLMLDRVPAGGNHTAADAMMGFRSPSM
jgi:hypothetical protein